jgi:hypothetical protein
MRIQNQIYYITERLEEWNKKLSIVKTMPSLLGKVFVYSGKSPVKNRILDWAFVEITGPAAHLFAPNKMPALSPYQLPEFYDAGMMLLGEGYPLLILVIGFKGERIA